MKLNLLHDNGVLIAQWNVKEDFGDLTQSTSRELMTLAIAEAVEDAQQYEPDGLKK